MSESGCHIAEGLRDLSSYMKDVLKGLRELRKYSPLAVKMLKIVSKGTESSTVSFY